MILTEEQAGTKQCRITAAAIIPHVNTGQLVNAKQAGMMTYGFSTCLGSKCAHWQKLSNEHGYCGMSGTPIGWAPFWKEGEQLDNTPPPAPKLV